MKDVRIVGSEVLSDDWYVLRKMTYETVNARGERVRSSREVYDRGCGAAVLLYNRAADTVVLVRQFRLPALVQGHADGCLIEACAGVLDGDDPEACVRREAEEETGFRVGAVHKVFAAYMSPGAVTEVVHGFIAEYAHDGRVGTGGGLAAEGEDIEVLEMPFTEAMAMMARGEICDAKTIMLLQHLAWRGWPEYSGPPKNGIGNPLNKSLCSKA